MSEPKRDEGELQIIELIQSKLEAGDADSGWVMAFVMMKLLPHVRRIADALVMIDKVLAPSKEGLTIREVLGELGWLGDINEKLGKLLDSYEVDIKLRQGIEEKRG